MTKKNRFYDSLICIILTACMLLLIVHPMLTAASENKIYVEDIKIYECEDESGSAEKAKKWFEEKGYVFTGIDLNQGTGTDECAYLGYKSTTNKDMAITDIRLMAMDTGYTIYNYEDMMNYLASQKKERRRRCRMPPSPSQRIIRPAVRKQRMRMPDLICSMLAMKTRRSSATISSLARQTCSFSLRCS